MTYVQASEFCFFLQAKLRQRQMSWRASWSEDWQEQEFWVLESWAWEILGSIASSCSGKDSRSSHVRQGANAAFWLVKSDSVVPSLTNHSCSLLNTTETGRPRIQRQTWRWLRRQTSTILVKVKVKVNACGHIPVRDLTMTYSVNSKKRTLIRGKSIHESLRGSILDSFIAECKRKLSVEAKYLGLPRKWLTLKLRSANNKLYWRSQQGERNVTTCVQLFDLTNKATWPKSLTFGATINCHSCLWIRGLPVSVVRIFLSRVTLLWIIFSCCFILFTSPQSTHRLYAQLPLVTLKHPYAYVCLCSNLISY